MRLHFLLFLVDCLLKREWIKVSFNKLWAWITSPKMCPLFKATTMWCLRGYNRSVFGGEGFFQRRWKDLWVSWGVGQKLVVGGWTPELKAQLICLQVLGQRRVNIFASSWVMLDNSLPSNDLQWFDLFLERTGHRTDLLEYFFNHSGW